MSFEILDPTHEGDSASFALASRLSALEGTTLGIISNGKKNTINNNLWCNVTAQCNATARRQSMTLPKPPHGRGVFAN